MRAKFDHKGHSVVVERGLQGAQLLIDDKLCAEKKGAFSVQFINFDLNGEIPNTDGTVDDIRISVRIGLTQDDVVFFCNGKEIESRKVRA